MQASGQPASAQPASAQPAVRVELVTSDERRFVVPYSQAVRCLAVKSAFEAYDEDDDEEEEDGRARVFEYRMPCIDEDTMCRVISYLQYHEKVPETSVVHPIPSSDIDALVLDAFDKVLALVVV